MQPEIATVPRQRYQVSRRGEGAWGRAWRQELLERLRPGARHELVTLAQDDGDRRHSEPRTPHLGRKRVGLQGWRLGGCGVQGRVAGSDCRGTRSGLA